MILVSWHHLGVIVIFIYPHILTYSLAKYLSIHNTKACFSSKRNIETHEKGKSMKQHICQEHHTTRFFRSRNTFGASESACNGKSGSPWAMEPCRVPNRSQRFWGARATMPPRWQGASDAWIYFNTWEPLLI